MDRRPMSPCVTRAERGRGLQVGRACGALCVHRGSRGGSRRGLQASPEALRLTQEAYRQAHRPTGLRRDTQSLGQRPIGKPSDPRASPEAHRLAERPTGLRRGPESQAEAQRQAQRPPVSGRGPQSQVEAPSLGQRPRGSLIIDLSIFCRGAAAMAPCVCVVESGSVGVSYEPGDPGLIPAHGQHPVTII